MRKQSSAFVVRTVRLQSGERLPMLLDGSTGLPLFQPTLYALTEIRGRDRSSATIQQALRSVMALYFVLGRLGIDLEARLAERTLLQAGEIEEVARVLSSADGSSRAPRVASRRGGAAQSGVPGTPPYGRELGTGGAD